MADGQGKLVLVYLHTEWCNSCRELSEVVEQNVEVRNAIRSSFIAVQFDAEKTDGKMILEHYSINEAYPMTLIVDKYGRELDHFFGWRGSEDYLQRLDDVVNRRNLLADLLEMMDAEPENGTHALAVAKKYSERGNYETAVQFIRRALQDPRQNALARNHFTLAVTLLNLQEYEDARTSLLVALEQEKENDKYLKFLKIIDESIARQDR